MAYPDTLDSFLTPTSGQPMNAPKQTDVIAAIHNALGALEETVGVTDSVDPDSHDYRIGRAEDDIDGLDADIAALASALSGKSNVGHTHAISDVSGLQAALDGKSAVGHTHDDRYYTESEVDSLLGAKISSIADPNANRLFGWDDTDNAYKFITIGANLAYDHSTHTLSASGGGGSPGGANKQVQFNDSGAFAGDSSLQWDKLADTLSFPYWTTPSNPNSGFKIDLISGLLPAFVPGFSDGAGGWSEAIGVLSGGMYVIANSVIDQPLLYLADQFFGSAAQITIDVVDQKVTLLGQPTQIGFPNGENFTQFGPNGSERLILSGVDDGGSGGGSRGGNTEYRHGLEGDYGDATQGFTFANDLGEFVFNALPQSMNDDQGMAWIKFLDGSARFDGGVQVGSASAYVLGDPDTDGSWRLIRSGTNLVIQRRVSGVWTTKSTISS